MRWFLGNSASEPPFHNFWIPHYLGVFQYHCVRLHSNFRWAIELHCVRLFAKSHVGDRSTLRKRGKVDSMLSTCTCVEVYTRRQRYTIAGTPSSSCLDVTARAPTRPTLQHLRPTKCDSHICTTVFCHMTSARESRRSS